MRAARLGQASIARDAAYADGQGNLTEALRLVRLQLELQPRHPRYLHDAATVQARRRYLGPSMARWEPATGPSTHPPGCLSAYRFMSLSIHPSTHPPTDPPTHPPIHQAVRSGVHPEAEAEALALFAVAQARRAAAHGHTSTHAEHPCKAPMPAPMPLPLYV